MPEKLSEFERTLKHNIERRRKFKLDGYKSLEDVELDGEYVTPLQIVARSATGPCLVAYNYIDAPTAVREHDFLAVVGYLPDIPFNKVLKLAFERANIRREDTYMTQAFHLLPQKRSGKIPTRDVRKSFEAITLHEIKGRRVVALGEDAACACKPFEGQYADYVETIHPSARGNTYEERAIIIAEDIKSVC